jgi:hypothetical protein
MAALRVDTGNGEKCEGQADQSDPGAVTHGLILLLKGFGERAFFPESNDLSRAFLVATLSRGIGS